MSDEAIRVERAGEVPWDDLVAVFGTRGDPASCWCQWFRMPQKEFRAASTPQLREQMREQSRSDPSPGVIAYLDDVPVGWCAVAPRGEYPVLARSQVARASPDASAAGVWTVTCFVVRVGYRRPGVAAALLTGAVDLARSEGARVVEGLPVDATHRASLTAAELYHGTISLFERAGFEVVARPTPARAVMRLAVG